MFHIAWELRRVFWFVLALSLLTVGGVNAAPTITSLSPTSGPVGSSVTITGNNFGSYQGPSWVGFNGASASVTSWSNTQIVVPVPNIATGTANVAVTVGGVASNVVSFNITSTPPAITNLSPNSGPVGTSVTITGTNFGSFQGPNQVSFNGANAPVTSWSNAQIVVPVPNIATGNANVVVTVGGVASNGVSFSITPVPPTITSLSPNSGPVGTSVMIAGTNFGSYQGPSWVGFNGSTAPVTSWSNTQIVVRVPNIATGNVNVRVTVGGIASNAISFNIVPTPPTITSLSPTSGPTGTSVTVTGTNFGAPQGSSTVSFNGSTVVPSSWSSTQIVFSIPAGATTGNVVVTVNGLPSNAISFTVAAPAPSITSVSPTTGSVGAPVTISGANFGATRGTSTVTFNGVPATPTSWASNGIIVPVPVGATTGNVAVQVAGAISNGVDFTVVAPPSITATVTPAPNANGWNNSVVQVTFNCLAGGLPLATCPSEQNVVTEGTNEIVMGTATDVSGGSTSTTVTLNIERTHPSISISSPADQSLLDSGTAPITGTVVNSLTSITGAACNGAAAAFSAGSFSCNISLVPGVNLVTVTATDYAGNTAGSRLHLLYSAGFSAPSSLQITPASANVLIGSTQQFTVVDQSGHARRDATWSVDNTNVATITTDSSPTLTGVAIGTVTLTASVGSVSAQVQVNVLGGLSLPPATVAWSAPTVPGFATLKIIQAVPTLSNTPSVYFLDSDSNANYLVRGFSGSGRQFWQTQIPNTLLTGIDAFNGQTLGDSSGGLLLFGSSPSLGTGLLLDLDGQSGAIAWQNSSVVPVFGGNQLANNVAVGPDGTLLLQDTWLGGFAGGGLLRIDPISGQSTRIYSAPASTGVNYTCEGAWPYGTNVILGYTSSPGTLTPPIVDSDGSVMFTVQYSTFTLPPQSCIIDPTINLFVKLAPDGTVTTVRLPIPDGPIPVQVVAPDGNGGALISWWTGSPAQPTSHMMSTTNGAVYPTPLNAMNPQPVLGENGNAALTDGNSVAAFNQFSGSVQWTYQPPQGVDSVVSTHGGGFTIVDGKFNLITLDANGNLGTTTSLASLNLAILKPTYFGSFEGIPSQSPHPVSIAGPLIDFADGSWDVSMGSLMLTRAADPMSKFPPLASCHDSNLQPPPSCPGPQEVMNTADSALIQLLSAPCPTCQNNLFNKVNSYYLPTFNPTVWSFFYSPAKFNTFMGRGASMFDGSRSSFRMDFLNCGTYWWLAPGCLFDGTSVSTWMSRNPSVAVAQPAGRLDHLLVFFGPQYVCLAQSPSVALLNEANLLHESLHGFYPSADDPTLEAILGVSAPSQNISYYLEANVLGGGSQYNVSGNGTYSCPTQ